MKIDGWVDEYKVLAFPWIDGKSIYFSVSYYAPGQSITRPPVWEKVVYITDNKVGRRAVYDFTHTVVNYIAGLKIPQGGYAKLVFQETTSQTALAGEGEEP